MNRKNQSSEKLPVLLMTYLKSDFLDKILLAIKNYHPPTLYIYVNQPKSNTEKKQVAKVQKILRSIDFNFRIEFIIPDTHLVVNDSFKSTLDTVFSKEESLIVLEDDTIPSQAFFSFCQRMINEYVHDESVGCVLGCNLNSVEVSDSYFHSSFALPFWGWASWSKVWFKYRSDNYYWLKHQKLILNRISNENRIFFRNCFDGNADGVNSWDIQWSLTLLANRLKTIVPGVNLIDNKGFVAEGISTAYKNSAFGQMSVHDLNLESLSIIDSNTFQKTYEDRLAQLVIEINENLKGQVKNRILNS